MEKVTTIFKEWASARRDMWPHWIIIAAILTAANVVAGMWLAITHPAAGEIWQNQLISLFLWCVTIAAVALWAIMARGVYKACQTEYEKVPADYRPIDRFLIAVGVMGKERKTQLLESWAIDGGTVDVVVSMRAGESYADYQRRVEHETRQACPAKWVAVVNLQEVGVIVSTGGEPYSFSRNCPPFMADLPPSQQLPEDIDFATEKPENYAQYVAWFSYHFRRWASGEKIRIDAKRAEKTMLEILGEKAKMSANILLLILCSVSAFSQKLEQVKASGIAGKVPPAGVEVSYLFEKGPDLGRFGNGRSTYAELLTALPGYRDNGGGKLIAIMAGGKSVYKAGQTEEVAEQPKTKGQIMRAASETIPPSRLGNGFQMPDNARMYQMADEMKFAAWKASQAAESVARPVQEVVMFAYWEWFWLILILTLAPWIVAALAAREGFWDIHRPAKRIVLLFTSVSVIIFVINIMLAAKWAGANNLALFLAAVALAWLALKFLDKINPDYRPAPGNESSTGAYLSNNRLQGRN